MKLQPKWLFVDVNQQVNMTNVCATAPSHKGPTKSMKQLLVTQSNKALRIESSPPILKLF